MIHLKHGTSGSSGKTLKILLFLIVVVTQTTEAQILTGRITDKSGQPVRFATVFVNELKQGTSSNTEGEYALRLLRGNYTIVCQSLGFEPATLKISLETDTLVKDVVLNEQLYNIDEVKIAPSGEDPAYPIMRKAIGLAPFYLNHISHYKADVYLKGNLEIKRIPAIAKKSFKIEPGKSSGGKTIILKEGDSFLMESFNEIEFIAPDKYVQKVNSFNTTFPEQGNEISPMDYIKASFYQPVIAGMAVSPLSPSAFSYYRFKYLGATSQGNYTISKIEVIPRRRSQQVFEGTICIIEDLWCLQSVDLTNNNFTGTISVKQLYIPVEDDIWMPVSHNFAINIGLMGFRADAGYSSSVKYSDVQLNNKLKRPDPFTGVYSGGYFSPDSEMTMTRIRIEKILQKDEISNRDMVKLSNLMKKESGNSMGKGDKKNHETGDNTKIIIAGDAGGKDSSYWAGIRPIPLSESELRSIRIRDSLKTGSGRISVGNKDTIPLAPQKKKSSFVRNIKYLATGHTWSDTTGLRFTFGGLVNPKSLRFNTVDGFVYGTDLRVSARFSNHRSLGFYPDFRYAFSREKLMWRANLNYSAGGMNPSQIFLRGGMMSRDLNSSGGVNPLINSFSSLFFRRNYLKLFDSRYITLGFRSEPVNGLKAEVSAGFEDRRILENTTGFSILKPARDYTVNVPVNEYLEPGSDPLNFLNNQKHYEIVTNVTITPYQRFRIENGRRISEGSDWPDFQLTWKHGINMISSSVGEYRHYDMLMLSISQAKETGAFSKIRWMVRTGGFADNRSLSYFDFFHFNSQPVPVLLDDYNDAFMLKEVYSLSTPELFAEAHLKYTTPYFLLKLLPGLSNTLIRENLSASYLVSRFHSNYTEIGYSLSEIFFFAEAGVYAGFEDLKFRSIGAKIIFRFN